MPAIEIWDRKTFRTDRGEHHQLAVRLHEVLEVLDSASPPQTWTIFELWAEALDDATDILAVEDAVARAQHGLQLSWAELRQLSEDLLQVTDGIFVAYRGAPPHRNDPDLRASAETIIEVIDSTFWRIYTRSRDVAARFTSTFADVREVEDAPVRGFHK